MSDIEELQVYEGSEPYIFLSYKREQKKLMLRLFNQLTKSGYRVWCDNGIHTGAEWLDVLAQKTGKCTHFIAIVTKEYFKSFFCSREMDEAVDVYKRMYESADDISNFCPPITLLLGDGITLDTIPKKYNFALKSIQHCNFNADETFDENSKTFKKILEIENLPKCKINSAPLNSEKLSENDVPKTESIAAETSPEDSPVITADQADLPEMTTYMVRSALADRAHNAALLFSKTDESIGCDLYKAAYRARNSLINQYPENEKENAKFSDLCSDIKDFACGHNIDVSEFFSSDTDVPRKPDETQTEVNSNTAAYNYDLGIKLKNDGNIEEAEKYLRTAADNGMTEAQLSLGVLLYKLNRKDEAEKYLRAAADNGAAKAQFNLGALLNQTNRKTEAEKYFRLSADNGFIPAYLSLGVICQKKNDLNNAEKYFRIAADSGLTDAQYDLGMLLKDTGRSTEAEQYLQLAAEKGHIGAQSELTKIT